MPARLSAFWVTATGPVSMIEGSEPIEANCLIRARGLRPSFLPISSLPMSTAAAPSTMPELLPAWWTWEMRSTSG